MGIFEPILGLKLPFISIIKGYIQKNALNELFKQFIQGILQERAANEARTRDPQLGKLMLYQLSYCRLFLC